MISAYLHSNQLPVRTIIFTLFAGVLTCTFCHSKLSPRGESSIPKNIMIDSILVKKAERTMVVFSHSTPVKTYRIALGKNPVGKKQLEGDYKTPEGLYLIDDKSAVSKFHKNLNISYPNKNDKEYAAAQNKSPGGDIKIHGLPNNFDETKYKRSDWTWGCIGLTNVEIDELYEHIRLGSPILILH